MRFQDTPFWAEADRERWHFAHVTKNVDKPSAWLDADGEHPLRRDSPALAADVLFDDIIHTMRHGLAHGCVVYLDENGDERPNRRVTQVAFLSRAKEKGLPPETRRLLVVDEEAFSLSRRLVPLAAGLQTVSDLEACRVAHRGSSPPQ